MKTYILLICSFVAFNSISQSTKKCPVAVTVMDAENLAIKSDKIVFIGRTNKKKIVGITDAKGQFEVNLPEGDTYEIMIDAMGDDLDYNTLEVPSIPSDAEFQEMSIQINYWMPEMITLSDLNFNTGQSTIMSNSYAVLNDLAEYLKRKSDLRIKIAGHTDSDGDETKNMSLSKNRALAVKAYLVKKGISAGRLTTEGFGENQPIADNATANGKAQNRRTEIHIL